MPFLPDSFRDWFVRRMPAVLAAVLLLSGIVLLMSAARPSIARRLYGLYQLLPLSFIEISHLASAITGLCLLLLARAVWLRVDSAYVASIVLLAFGIVASLVKGFDYEEAAVLAVALLLFLPTRHLFTRRSALLDSGLSPWWLLSSAGVLAGVVWIGLQAYQNIPYDNSLWLKFALNDNLSRFLRGSAVAWLLLLVLVFYRLLIKPAAPDVGLPDEATLGRARAIVQTSPDTSAWLALTGDKCLFWSDSGNSFLMYRTRRRYWIVMGDPVGDAAEFPALLWAFREKADQYRASIAFYEVGTAHLPLYLELGMALLKLGESAQVPLAGFSLKGGKHNGQRYILKRLEEREGCCFSVWDAPQVLSRMAELQAVSDAWLHSKKSAEKGFSLGFFDPAYVASMRVGVIEREGRVLAFANLWEASDKSEIALDMMRYSPDSPDSVMEFLLLKLMLWATEQGFGHFSLGMAPLAGLKNHPLAPLWFRMGHAVYHFGQEFYNFEGLRAWKNKFSPSWIPRYLVLPPGKPFFGILLAVTALIAGGWRGVVRRVAGS